MKFSHSHNPFILYSISQYLFAISVSIYTSIYIYTILIHYTEQEQRGTSSLTTDKMGNYNSSADDYKKSLLPKDVQAILQRGMREGYKDGFLYLLSKWDNYFILSFVIC